MEAKEATAFISRHWQILVVLAGCFLIAAPMAAYTNWDAQLEFEAATNIVNRGFPIVTTGLLINQPPLGFYTAAPFFEVFGLTYQNGVALATAFGLGSVALVYALGALLYGRKTGLAAAALFGFIPWHVYLSRIFLIDNQCLFLSLLFLAVGVLAVKRNSERLVLLTGVVFSLALLTKLFAVFMLVPFALIIFFDQREGKFRVTKRNAFLFVLPTLILQAVWYGGFANQNFLGVYFSTDFSHPIHVADPNLIFLPIILVKSAGWFVFLAAALSLAAALVYRRQLSGYLRLDLICLTTIAAIAGFNAVLVLIFHLTPPYVSVVKYTYMALPFFCLLAASIADKSKRLIGTFEFKKKIQLLKPAFLAAGLILVFASLLESTLFLNTWVGFVSFGVDSVTYYGFNLYSNAPASDVVAQWHLAGLVLVVAALAVPPLADLLKTRRSNLKPAA